MALETTVAFGVGLGLRLVDPVAGRTSGGMSDGFDGGNGCGRAVAGGERVSLDEEGEKEKEEKITLNVER
jgi:hypothetical protein